MRYAFVFDQHRCTGCHACRLACTIDNALPLTTSWRSVYTFNAAHHPGLPLFHLSLACNHCARPACLEACPAAAYARDPQTGAILLDETKCLGCRYCSWACPYDAPVFDASRGVMTKCTFCVDRLRQGMQPACAAYCPTGALRVATQDEPDLTVAAPGMPDRGLGPAVRIEQWRGPGHTASAHGAAAPERQGTLARPKITLASEWSLAAFTMIAAILLAAFAGAARGALALHPAAFAGVAAAGMLLSAAHLGRKERAWRAVLNLRTSWLSREVAAFSLFAGVGTLFLWLWPDSGWLGATATAVGALALLSADRVYAFALRADGGLPHSASVLLTGVLLAAVFAGDALLAGVLATIVVLLYLERKRRFVRKGLSVRPVLTGVRLLAGIVLPALLWLGERGVSDPLLAAVVLGAAIDRAEFYDEIDIMTPQRHLAETEATQVALARRSREGVAA